jgi:hypothetical protein
MFSIGYLRQKASNMCRDFLPNRASSYRGDFQGVVMMGVDRDYDWEFFKSNLREGEILTIEDSHKSVRMPSFLRNCLTF